MELMEPVVQSGLLPPERPHILFTSSFVTHRLVLPWNSPFLCRFTFIPSFETTFRLPGDVSLVTSSRKLKTHKY